MEGLLILFAILLVILILISTFGGSAAVAQNPVVTPSTRPRRHKAPSVVKDSFDEGADGRVVDTEVAAVGNDQLAEPTQEPSGRDVLQDMEVSHDAVVGNVRRDEATGEVLEVTLHPAVIDSNSTTPDFQGVALDPNQSADPVDTDTTDQQDTDRMVQMDADAGADVGVDQQGQVNNVDLDVGVDQQGHVDVEVEEDIGEYQGPETHTHIQEDVLDNNVDSAEQDSLKTVEPFDGPLWAWVG